MASANPPLGAGAGAKAGAGFAVPAGAGFAAPADGGVTGGDPIVTTPSTEIPEPLPDRATLHTANRPLLTIGIMAATLMQILDSTIANVALPKMQATLGATADTITWVLTSYIVASAVAIPLTGWLSDRLGSRTLFLASTIGFVLTSMLCGLATSLPEMVAFRVLQGIAAAFMSPLSQTAMIDINKPSRQAQAMSIWGMGIMVGPVLGPILGGYLTESYNWRWVFYVNLPIGIACTAILWTLLPSRPLAKRNFDTFGFSLLAIAIASFQIMLDRGQSADWFQSWEIRIEGGIALISAWMFLVHMVTAKRPMFDRALLRDRNLITGMFFMIVTGIVMMATMALLPPMLQTLFGYPVFDTGLLLVPRGIGVMVAMAIGSQALQRGFDPRIQIGIGLAIAALSLYEMTGWTLQMGATQFIVSGFVQGLGLGCLFIPINIIAFGTLPGKYRTEGASLMNLSRNIGASVGISVVTALLGYNIQASHQELGGHITADSISSVDPGIASAFGSAGETITAMINAEVNRQALMIAYLDDFKLMMILTALTVPLVLLLRRPIRPAAGQKEEAVHVAFD